MGRSKTERSEHTRMNAVRQLEMALKIGKVANVPAPESAPMHHLTTPEEAAIMLGTDMPNVYRLMATGKLPEPAVIASQPLWSTPDIIAYASLGQVQQSIAQRHK